MEHNILFKYLSQRVEDSPQRIKPDGPVVTISREYGCYASQVADELATALNLRSLQSPIQLWECISKEVLEDAAKKLNTGQQQIAHIFGADELNLLGDMIISFANKKYVSDDIIKKTITRVVRSYANRGQSIIVGRASCIIARSIEKSLHVKIIAPFEWRVAKVAERHGLSSNEAIKRVNEFDKKRATFMKFFNGNLPESELFHAVFNRKMLSTAEIVEAILKLMAVRKLI